MSLPTHDTQRSLFEVDRQFPELFDANPAAARFSFFAKNILPQLHAMRSQLEPMYCADNGRPGEEPVILLGLCLLQFMERQPDRQATGSCAFDLRWKLALGMEADQNAFHPTCLVRFRQRLLEHGLEGLGFEAAMEAMRKAGYLKGKTKRQRLDSTHVLGLVSHMSRLENVRESTRLALQSLHKMDDLPRPEQWTIWWERYVANQPDYRVEATELKRRFDQAGQDVRAILDWIDGLKQQISKNKAVDILGQVFEENFKITESGQCEQTRAQPPGAIQNPHDPDSQWSSKSTIKGKEWVGYKAQIAETVAEEICQNGEPTPNVITAIVTQEAIASDKAALPPVEKEWADNTIDKPEELYVDGGYTSGHELHRATQEDRTLQGPMARAPVKDKRYSVEDFDIRVEERQATCPEGKTNSQCSKLTEAATGKVSYRIEFATKDCQGCPATDRCLGKGQKHRTITIGEHHTLIQGRRREQSSDEFKKDMYRRNGIEATISELARGHGLRRSRYRGQTKTRLQNNMIGAACNIRRWAARSAWEKATRSS